MKTIILTQNQIAIIDDIDFDLVNPYKWCTKRSKHDNTYYAITRNKGKGLFMHNLIMGVIGIDHIDNDGLNNTRSNLRVANQSQNAANQNKQKRNCTSKYKGVYFKKSLKKWIAQIKFLQRKIHIGSFVNEIDAAKAYDVKAKELFGEFAKTNF